MSLCITALTPAGIILTADSRQTYRNVAGMTRIGTDNAVKLFRLTPRAGVVIAGRAFFPDSGGVLKNAGWFIEEFAKREEKDIAGASLKDLGQKLTEFFIREFFDPEEKRLQAHIASMIAAEGGTNLAIQPRNRSQIDYSFTGRDGNKVDKQWFIESLSFIVAGYDPDGVGRGFAVLVPDLPRDEFSRNTLVGGILRIGQDDVVTRVINGWSPELFNLPIVRQAQQSGIDVHQELNKAQHIIEWGIMTLQDAIDFCVLMTRTTESVQRFSDGTFLTPGGITGVGGAIDVAKITPEDGFQWIRRKQLVVTDE